MLIDACHRPTLYFYSTYDKKIKKEMTTLVICILIMIYFIKGKDVKHLLAKLKNVNWHYEINALINKLYPWALKAGRRSTRPILQFYYVMADEKTSTLDRALIYAAIAYTILPMDLIPSVVYKLLGIVDDGVAVLYVYKKVKKNITPAISAKVEGTLNEWFGTEYEVIGN